MRRRSWIFFVVLGTIIGARLLRLPVHRLGPPRSSINQGAQKHTEPDGAGAAPVPIPKLPSPVLPNLKDDASMRRILADSDPGAVALFQDGMRLMYGGDSAEARSKFERIMEAYPKDKVKALASWAIGLSFYLAYYWQGGTYNLHQAANQFISFRDAYESDENLEELVQAAMIDIPVVSIDLMHFAPTEYERTQGAILAEATLQAFLERWPNDPRAAAVRASLAEVRSYISNPR